MDATRGSATLDLTGSPPLSYETLVHEHAGTRFTVVGMPLAGRHDAFPDAPPGPQLLVSGTPLRGDDLAACEAGLRALVARWPQAVALPGAALTVDFGHGADRFRYPTATILVVLGTSGDD